MNDYSKSFMHLKKSESLTKKKKLSLDNSIFNGNKPKMFYKINKPKRDTNNKGNSNKKMII